MAKLQRITRTDGTYSYSVNMPVKLIYDLLWEKGDDLDLGIDNLSGENLLIINKKVEE